jgi:hypothetical protein
MGVRASFAGPIKYEVEAGKTENAHSVFAAEAAYETDDYGLGAGIYHFNKDGNESGQRYFAFPAGSSRNIYMVKAHHVLGAFDFGVMGLHGAEGDIHQNGYVFSVVHGKEDSWNKGSFMYYGKYYHQPYTTYIEHTMNGMADYMNGFKGYGLGFSYTPVKDWIFSMECDWLRDLKTDEQNRTIWAGLTYFFADYDR